MTGLQLQWNTKFDTPLKWLSDLSFLNRYMTEVILLTFLTSGGGITPIYKIHHLQEYVVLRRVMYCSQSLQHLQYSGFRDLGDARVWCLRGLCLFLPKNYAKGSNQKNICCFISLI